MATGELGGSDRLDPVLEEQIAYYRARAGEYDEWWLRQRRYDQGVELNQQWFAEVAEVQAKLQALAPYGRVLELACGTGWWTEQLALHADHITALDAAPEVIALNRERVGSASVRYEVADLFTWQPSERYDLVFFSFWLSHVPEDRFAQFWSVVRDALAPGGRVFFIDSLYIQSSTAHDQVLQGSETATMQRRLNDGREFHIVKVYYPPADLTRRLRALGWAVDVQATASYFLYGAAKHAGSD
jgi:trans-aconitate methyltransferase